ncbi:DEAD/DEAH box helicase [Candidatus Nitrospira salsa]
MSSSDSTSETLSFSALGLSDFLLQDLAKAGFQEPTPIQAKAIPPALEGRDVLGCAQTGTGKTAAFIIPMIERLAQGAKGDPRGLVLAPTRELAIQIQQTVDRLGRSRRIFATTVVGGADMNAQIRGLRQRPDIIVATPGRLLDHMWQGTIRFTKLQIVVLDEADRMLDMGFAPQLNQIMEAVPDERQTLLFSATMPTNLGDLARMSLKDPVRAMVSKSATLATGVTQTLHHTTSSDKTPLLLSLLKGNGKSVLVFTRTKHRADRLGETLERGGHRVAVLHGGRRLAQRRTALEGFRRGRFQILVATDIAARGLDVANIGHVINYDLPNVPEDYVHRLGRTARMKAEGCATSFVTVEDSRHMREIEKLLGQPVPSAPGSRPRFQPVSQNTGQRQRPGFNRSGPPRQGQDQPRRFGSNRRSGGPRPAAAASSR